jgi:HAD superfamily hydrolase (TIGR01459 family)
MTRRALHLHRMPAPVYTLTDLADSYDAVLCDIWGVIHNGRDVFKAAVDALAAFRGAGKAVVLVSNVPKPRDPIPGQLLRLGAPAGFYDAIVTSGDAIRAELATRAPGPLLKIGPTDDDSLWRGLGLVETGSVEAAAFVAISGLNDPSSERPEDYAATLEAAKAKNLELLCANPDVVVRVGDDLVWCAGAVAQLYEKMGGRVVMAGKPHPPIYRLALTEAAAVAGCELPLSRVLAVGDGLMTDVMGANRAGIDVWFIAAGIHGADLETEGRLDLAKVESAMAAEGVSARYVSTALR